MFGGSECRGPCPKLLGDNFPGRVRIKSPSPFDNWTSEYTCSTPLVITSQASHGFGSFARYPSHPPPPRNPRGGLRGTGTSRWGCSCWSPSSSRVSSSPRSTPPPATCPRGLGCWSSETAPGVDVLLVFKDTFLFGKHATDMPDHGLKFIFCLNFLIFVR